MNSFDYSSNIKVIKTRKYKDINLYLRFSIENNNLLKEKLALLVKIIGDVSNKYPTKSEMTKAKDMLYGISCYTSYKVRSNIISFSVHYSFINPKFVSISIQEYNDFIKETLFNSVIDENTLTEAKREIIASILRKLDKPTSQANERFIEIVSEDNKNFSINSEGKEFIENINKIELNDLYTFYQDMLKHAWLDIYVCGDLSKKDICCLTDYNFANRKKVKFKTRKFKYNQKNEIIDKKEISQSYLSVVFSTPYNKKHKDFFAWFIGNAFFGSSQTSLLFNNVREKMSLCYSIVSIDYKNDGLVRVVTSIDGKNKDKVIDAINNEINRIRKLDFDFKQFEITKKLICNTILSLYDDLDSLVDYYYESKLSNFNYSIEEYSKNLMKVQPQDICKVFKNYKPYFNYTLLGTKND